MAKNNPKAIVELAAAMAQRKARDAQQRDRRAVNRPPHVPKEPLVNPFAASHGDYREDKIVDLGNELGGGRQMTYKVLLNRGGSPIERWIAEQDSKLFGKPQIEAIRHCQRLWGRIDYQSSIVTTIGISGVPGQAEQDARDELNDYEKKIPRKYWSCFENIVRFETQSGVAGSQLANNSRTAVEAAKLATAFVASMIAQWRGL